MTLHDSLLLRTAAVADGAAGFEQGVVEEDGAFIGKR